MKKGEFTTYDKETGDRLCQLIVEKQTLRTIFAREDMPSVSTFYKWLIEDKAFAEQYARAKEIQIDLLVNEIIDIADNTQDGQKTKINDDGKNITEETVTADMIDHRKLRIEARKWYAGKMKPKKYGDSITMKGDADAPIEIKSAENEQDKKVLAHFIKNYAHRATLTAKQIDDGEDLV
jgi:hypothetical protein